MKTRKNIKLILSRFSFIVLFLFLFDDRSIFTQEVFLCIWRNPERTMTRIFPDAKDYRTVTLDISREDLEAVESTIGFPLLPGQREKFQYFEMTGAGGDTIGYIIAGSQKGEYGAIEFVFGMDAAFTMNGIYIQRSRERNQSFKEQSFLDLFIGLKPRDYRVAGNKFQGQLSMGTSAVIQGVIKELAVFNRLVQKNIP